MPEEPIRDPALVNQLCVKCGICCSGVLFPHGDLEPDEVEFARSVGLDVLERQAEDRVRRFFRQPCPLLSDTLCTAYGNRRPSVCDTFYCQLARTLDSGALSLDEAAAKVSQAQALVSDIIGEMEPGASLAVAYERLRDSGPVEEGRAHTTRARLLLATLAMLLDRYFRPPDSPVMKRGDIHRP